jgi:hypothetical protein
MSGEERCGYTCQHQAREYGDGQYILLDLLPPLWLGRPKYDALHAVVDSPARLEGDRVRGAGKVVEVCLEQPEGLRDILVPTWASRRHCVRIPTSSAPFTDSSHRSIMNSSSAMDSLSMLMRRWHSLWPAM